MIQDIQPKQFYNQYRDIKITNTSYVLLFQEQKVFVKKTEEQLQFPTYQEMKEYVEKTTYLFAIDEETYFLGSLNKECSLEGFTWEATSIFRQPNYGYRGFAGITAYQLYQWYCDNKLCGRCGSTLEHSHQERMLQCPVCGQMIYPKISPAVIVAITNGDKLLLTKYAAGDYKRYALVAGFTEIGETIEETVHREVMEEVGLRVKKLRYYKSQPWSFTGTLLFGFFAEVDGDTTIKMDDGELSVAEWVDRENVPHDKEEISLTREMMELFYRKGNPFTV